MLIHNKKEKEMQTKKKIDRGMKAYMSSYEPYFQERRCRSLRDIRKIQLITKERKRKRSRRAKRIYNFINKDHQRKGHVHFTMRKERKRKPTKEIKSKRRHPTEQIK